MPSLISRLMIRGKFQSHSPLIISALVDINYLADAAKMQNRVFTFRVNTRLAQLTMVS
jgi:hypothetical protein